MIIAMVWIALAIVVGAAAAARGRSGFGYFLLAVLLSPLIGGLIVAILPDLKTRELLERIAESGRTDDKALDRAVAGKRPRDDEGMARALIVAAIVAVLLGLLYFAEHH